MLAKGDVEQASSAFKIVLDGDRDNVPALLGQVYFSLLDFKILFYFAYMLIIFVNFHMYQKYVFLSLMVILSSNMLEQLAIVGASNFLFV